MITNQVELNDVHAGVEQIFENWLNHLSEVDQGDARNYLITIDTDDTADVVAAHGSMYETLRTLLPPNLDRSESIQPQNEVSVWNDIPSWAVGLIEYRDHGKYWISAGGLRLEEAKKPTKTKAQATLSKNIQEVRDMVSTLSPEDGIKILLQLIGALEEVLIDRETARRKTA